MDYNGCQDNAFNAAGSINVASSGNNGANLMELNFGAAAAVGTTTIGPGVPTSFQIETTSGAIWIANQSQGSGTLNITTLTASGATGTFLFSAPASSGGATGTMAAFSGTFTVTF